MDSQYTPTYHRLWNRDFTMLIVAELLLCITCYMTIPFLPYRLYKSNYVDAYTASMTMVMFVAGICLSGFFSCWLIQHYRRNKVFLVSAICLAAAIFCLPVFDCPKDELANDGQTIALMAVCTAGGFMFGQAKRVLSCTLLIDKTESCHRTEANYTAIWTARMMVVAGPILAMQLSNPAQNTLFYGVGAVASLVAVLLVLTVKFPFRAPEEGTRVISIDRFFLPSGWNVAIVIALMGGAFGILMVTHASNEFLLAVAAGLAISMLTLRYTAVRNGQYTSAVGNTCILAALAAMTLHNGLLDDTLKPMLFGLGFGLTSSEQLYRLLDRCDHCQRSTAESTYFMASDGGFFLGIAAGLGSKAYQYGIAAYGEHAAIALFVIATVICSANTLVKKKTPGHHA